MRIEETRGRGARGVELHRIAWLPEQAGPDAVVIAHGYAEHSGRYREVAEALVEDGLAVHALDHRGHGRSGGPTVNVEDFQHYVDDLDQLVVEVVAQHPGRTFLLGHSMGGLIAAVYATQHQDRLAGLILTGPAVMGRRVSTALNVTARLLARVLPGAGVLKLPLEAISRDPEVVRRYQEDSLVHDVPMRARQAVLTVDAQADLKSRLAQITIPVLIMHGGADRIVDPASAAFIHDRVSSPDRTLKVYQGLYHEILNEPEREEVIGDLRRWLSARRSVSDGGQAGGSAWTTDQP